MARANLSEQQTLASEAFMLLQQSTNQKLKFRAISAAALSLQCACRGRRSRKALIACISRKRHEEASRGRDDAASRVKCGWKGGRSRRVFRALVSARENRKDNRAAACIQCVMKAFTIRKWWRQLFVSAKAQQHAAETASGGEAIVRAWRGHAARRVYRSARVHHVIKCRTLAAVVVQRSIRCHEARVAMRSGAAAAAAAARESELTRVLAYEVLMMSALVVMGGGGGGDDNDDGDAANGGDNDLKA